MHQITLNIGLNVERSEPREQLNETLCRVADRCQIESVQIVAGEWSGVAERCAVLTVRRRTSRVIDYTKLCTVLRQDAIAVSDGATIEVHRRDGSTEHGNPALFHYDLGAHSTWQPE